MKAHQRLIREAMALKPGPDEYLKREAAASFDNAFVREISHAEAATVIEEYEWLQSMGSSAHCYGLFFRHPVMKVEYLGGVACFGATGGTNSHASVCGEENAHVVRTLTRGACVHWADCKRVSSNGTVHTGAAASFLINRACALMAERGFHVFIAYADPAAGEQGIVYRAANWMYCGQTAPTEEFRWTKDPVQDDQRRDWKDGNWHNARLVHCYTRNRSNRRLLRALRHHGFGEDQGKKILGCRREPYLQNLTRKEQRDRMIAEGFEFRLGHPKGRYVHFSGDKRLVRKLRKALKWGVERFPERQQIEISGVLPREETLPGFVSA